MNANVLHQIQCALQALFDSPGLQIDRTTTAADVVGWDSLSHVRLLMSLEDEFNIRFASLEADSMKNIGDLADLIAVKIVGTR